MSIYRRKSGRYAVLIDLEPTSTGGRRRRSLGTYATRKDAERAERDALTARDRGIDLAPASVTVATLITRYIERCKTADCAPKTTERYEELARLHIVPIVGETPVAKLKPAHVSEIYARAKRGGLSAKTVRHVHSVLSAALAWAVDQEVAIRNVATKAAKDLPKVQTSPARALTEAEARALLEAAKDTPWHAFLALALFTGARRGEIAALRWSGIDLDRRSATISESLTLTRGNGLSFKGTKTGAVRAIPLNTLAIEALRLQKARQNQERLRIGQAYEANDLVFSDASGRPWNLCSISNAFKRITRRAGLSVRLHDLRHTAATWMLQGRTDVRTVAGVLGHNSATTTLKTYSHVMPGAMECAVDTISERLSRPNLSAV
jgi:integrase